MIDVTITICGRPIVYQSATNVTPPPWRRGGVHTYCLADGRKLKHLRQNGAVKLAIKMLKMTKEPR